MPQASDEQRALMEKWFGDAISEEGPMRFLESHGFVLQKDWTWQLPTSSHSISCYEGECLTFLINEWDFGGTVESPDRYICLCEKRDECEWSIARQ